MGQVLAAGHVAIREHIANKGKIRGRSFNQGNNGLSIVSTPTVGPTRRKVEFTWSNSKA